MFLFCFVFVLETGDPLHQRHDLPHREEGASAGGDAGGLGGQQWHDSDGGRAGQQAGPHLENQERAEGEWNAVTPVEQQQQQQQQQKTGSD